MAAVFRHKTISRFRIGKFQFENGLLTILNRKDEAIFRDRIGAQPARIRNAIVEIDQAAATALERPMARTVRGAQQSRTVPGGSSEGVRAGVKDMLHPDDDESEDLVKIGIDGKPIEPSEEQKALDEDRARHEAETLEKAAADAEAAKQKPSGLNLLIK